LDFKDIELCWNIELDKAVEGFREVELDAGKF
jgi:hypothetical protein